MLSLFPFIKYKTVYKAILQKLLSVVNYVILREVLKSYEAPRLGHWHFSVRGSWTVSKTENTVLGEKKIT